MKTLISFVVVAVFGCSTVALADDDDGPITGGGTGGQSTCCNNGKQQFQPRPAGPDTGGPG